MFKKMRVLVLLYVLLFVAAAQFLAARRSTDWDNTLWVDVYPINGDGLQTTQHFVDELDPEEFTGVEEFFAAEARRYGLTLSEPFRLNAMERYDGSLPVLPADASPLATLWWSLEMRWIATKISWSSRGPSPDIVVFAVFHDAADSAVLDRSTA